MSWSDLSDKGYVVVREFLSRDALDLLCAAYESAARQEITNKNFNIVNVPPTIIGEFEDKVDAVARAVQESTGIDADTTVNALFFATEGIKFAWHQDHESFYVFQDHYHYLNFYIPFIKPDASRSNICVVPFDTLRSRDGEHFSRLVGFGAKKFTVEGNTTLVSDDERGQEYLLPFSLEELQVVPELGEGDLLLMRGDIVHRTQDSDTRRVAISIRRTRASNVISRTKLLSGPPRKREMIAKNKAAYDAVLKCFERTKEDTITVKQLVDYFRAAS